ncbi:hypothetical protein EYF80_064007 [Liparis tanakae]|uniref:Uncharacterized protein n=1 Tax=Liparis tanakae TaxID=230148 RepID=A0A4Z2EBC8_9TELE|nr:hypothetical protein EYF80_064007 [Liparis tanakae]
MWVGAAERGGTNKAGSGPRYAAVETSGDVLGSLLPSRESLAQSGGPPWGLERCHVSRMTGSVFDV